jgi:hypothetical protein
MNAYEIPNLRFSVPAGEAVGRRLFVAVDTDGKGVVATADGTVIGVSMNQAAADEVLEIADGIVMVEAGDVIAAGSSVSVGTAGTAAVAVAGIVVGTALTAATAAGQLIAVKIG